MKQLLIALLAVTLVAAGLLVNSGVAAQGSQVAPADFVGPIQFIGKVQALPATGAGYTMPNVGIWKVQGLVVEVTADSQVKGSPQIGSIVNVKGTISSDGVAHARSIKVIEGEIEFTGFVESLPPAGLLGTWTVQGLAVEVTEGTEIKGTLRVGSFVKVEGTLEAGGMILAEEIKVQGIKLKDESRPGLGLGDRNHKHNGAPGLVGDHDDQGHGKDKHSAKPHREDDD